MMVQPMVATGASAPTSSATASSASSPDDVTENDFLQLLVAQIQHQDPSSPTDSTTFVTQLATFSQLEQIIAIRGDIESQMSTGTSAATTNTTAPQGGN